MATPFGTTWPSTLKLFVDELQTHVPDDGLTLTASYRTPVTCRSFGLVTGDWGVGVVHLSGSDYNRSFMAVLADGTAVGYGSDDGGRLSGAAGQTGLVRTALGSEHCVGLKSDGTVVQWGATTEAVPEGLTDVVWVCAGQYGRSWAVKSDGAVVSWGSGAAAVLPESFTSGIARLDVGYTDSDGIAVKLDGTVIYWGYDYNQRFSSIPNTITDAVDARLCGQNSIILRATGEVLVYGIGRVGNQQPVYQAANAVEIAAKWYVWMVRFADGTVFAGNPGAYGETDFSSLPTGYRAVAIAAANYASAIGYDAPAEVDGLLKFEPVGQAGATKLSFKIADVEKAWVDDGGGLNITNPLSTDYSYFRLSDVWITNYTNIPSGVGLWAGDTATSIYAGGVSANPWFQIDTYLGALAGNDAIRIGVWLPDSEPLTAFTFRLYKDNGDPTDVNNSKIAAFCLANSEKSHISIDGGYHVGSYGDPDYHSWLAPTLVEVDGSAGNYFYGSAGATDAWFGIGSGPEYLDIDCNADAEYGVRFNLYFDNQVEPHIGFLFQTNSSDAPNPRIDFLFKTSTRGNDNSRMLVLQNGTGDRLTVDRDGVVWAYGGFESYDDMVSIVLRSPDRSRWRIKVDNAGVISATKLP